MKDGSVRRVVKAVALAAFRFDVGLHRAVERLRGRSRFVLGGDCRRCAACCEAPAIQVGWFTWYFPMLTQLFLWWHRVVNGLELTGRDFRGRALIFRCTHFDAEARACDSYDSRPGMCRDYPRLLLHQPHPELLPGCGYRPVARDAKRFLRVLADQDLTPDQRARLKKELFLED